MVLVGIAAAAALAVIGALWGLAAYHVYHGIGPQKGILRAADAEPVVSLSFDDGPSPAHTPAILDILAGKGVKATFFVVGEHVRAYPDVARRIASEGHDIGNHTNTHKNLVPAARSTVARELEGCDAAIREVVGIKPQLFRPPRGIYRDATRRLVESKGYRLILWSLSTIDWRGKSARAILRRVQARAKPGDIILCHDSGALMRSEGGARHNIVEALPELIDYLREVRGYEIIPVSEMLRRLGGGPARAAPGAAPKEV